MERIWNLPLCHCFLSMLNQYTHRWKVRVVEFEAEDRSNWYCLARGGCTGYSLIGWRGYTGPGGLQQAWLGATAGAGTVGQGRHTATGHTSRAVRLLQLWQSPPRQTLKCGPEVDISVEESQIEFASISQALIRELLGRSAGIHHSNWFPSIMGRLICQMGFSWGCL